ncbi:Type IV fimbrial assembly, ATPase PilB [Candidatus Burkholderia verschuerenii]|uniref:Type IV fimbrial assembly, ATPase PilB n=1 Tax=Candidatus Burkholderia verschuerenii TaxID=242163 RepID=A0A0L0MHZ1_9BURK|nr:ATPase, T2SS/T4P/T4SS family [Candidatus Burkholderia verschuerenii]KND62307.1 Type IV fimbrial assembly, ATPase PilB [Candidatus Burkholderia verschuerenii]
MQPTELDDMLLLEAATYSDWHVDIAKPETSVVFREVNEDGERLAEAKPSKVPQSMLPVLFHMATWLKEHRDNGDQDAFALDIGNLRYRGQRMRADRYALRRSRKEVEKVKELGLGRAAEELLLDPEFRSGGLILVCGETGAGKSTTIRSAVKARLETYGGYALGVESPVEVEFEGFHGEGYFEQVDATAMGYKYEVETAMRKFPAATRSMFMFGEVLGQDAAAELVRLAPRGHLVLTTIHADSPESGIRMLLTLAERGGESYARQLLGSSLRAVVHQKLQRGKPVVQCFKADDVIRNVIGNPETSLSNLASAIDQAKRQLASQALRAGAATQPRMHL